MRKLLLSLSLCIVSWSPAALAGYRLGPAGISSITNGLASTNWANAKFLPLAGGTMSGDVVMTNGSFTTSYDENELDVDSSASPATYNLTLNGQNIAAMQEDTGAYMWWFYQDLKFFADNTHDIGEAAANRPKDIHAAGSFYEAGAALSSKYVPQSRTVTVNGTPGTLSSNLSFTVASGSFSGTDLAYTNVMTLTSAAIQGAIDSLSSTYGAGRVNLTRGTYVMAAGGINVSNNIEIVGSGWGTILDSTGQAQGAAVITIRGHDVVLRDFEVLSDRAGGTAWDQISIPAQQQNVLIDRLKLLTSDNDAIDSASTLTSNLIVRGCWIYDPDQHGIDDAGTDYFTFSDNWIDSCDGDGIDADAGAGGTIDNNKIWSIGTHGIYVGNQVAITKNYVHTTGQYGIIFGNSCRVIGNMLNDCGRAGLWGASANQTVVANNTFKVGTSGWDDILIAGGSRLTIVGNTSQASAGQAETFIHLDGVQDSSVIGNTSEGHDTGGIQIDADCDGNLVQGNNLEGEAVAKIINNQPTAPTSPKVGVDKFSDDSGVQLNATANGMNDDSFNGVTIGGLNAGEAITQWDLVYLYHADTELHQADADAIATCQVMGMAVAAGSDGNECVILRHGVVRNDGWNWISNGVPLYASTTAGGIQTNAPSGSGDVVRIVGQTLSDDEILLDIDQDWAVVP